MKKLTLYIHNCRQCPDCSRSIIDPDTCNISGRFVPLGGGVTAPNIPDWCPLETVQAMPEMELALEVDAEKAIRKLRDVVGLS